MSVVARERLAERVEAYAAHNPDATLPEILGRFRLSPEDEGDERALVESVLADEITPDELHDGTGVAEGNA